MCSTADIYGIALSFYTAQSVVNKSIDTLSFTWSGIQAEPSFANGSTPMPILMTDEVIPYGLEGSLSWNTTNGTILHASNTYAFSLVFDCIYRKGLILLKTFLGRKLTTSSPPSSSGAGSAG